MNYMTIREAAEKWGISQRLAQRYCTEGRIEGANKFGGTWAIPEDAQKPTDPRRDKTVPTSEFSAEERTVTPRRIPMPLLNTPFVPGYAMEAVVHIADEHQRNIALAEYYYFSGQAEKASEIAEKYLQNEDIALSLSACWIYAYANLALGRPQFTQKTIGIIRQVRENVGENTPPELAALSACVSTATLVLLHLPLPEDFPRIMESLHLLPHGLRLLAVYVHAHYNYLNGKYGAAVGMVETALAFQGPIHPIPTIYLHMVAAMSFMSMNHPDLAKHHVLEAWKLAQPDDLLEAFGEHHGLLGGTIEAVIKKDWPDDFKRIIAITYSFSAGWRKIHNPVTGNSVADDLTTTEFSVAMLAARGWSNKEIGAHMGIAENTVKHYISTALQKLNISQRKELKQFMLK